MSDLIDIKSESEKVIWIKRILQGLEITNKVKSESYLDVGIGKNKEKRRSYCKICYVKGKVRPLKDINSGKSEGKFIKGI